MKLTRNFLATMAALIGILTSTFGVVWFADGRYTMASDQQALAKEVKKIKARNALDGALDDLYFYKKQTRKYPGDEDLQKKLSTSEEDVKYLKKVLKLLEKPKLVEDKTF